MKKIVLSLGGSVIIPKEVDYKFLNKFKETLRKNYAKYQFVVVCGGGIIARKYIRALKKQGRSLKEQSLAGIRATRMNALFMTQFFGKEANETLPKNMKEVRNNLKQNKVVFCGALRYADNETSDGTAAKLAHFLKADFINLSNVSGLYSANPKTHKNAKFIPKITWDNFEKRALKIEYKPGQHFVLDQKAAIIIRKNRIPTYLIGSEIKNLDNILNHKKFEGTIIRG